MVSPLKLPGEYQSLRLCVKVEDVPSAYATVNVCDFWLPSTPVASIIKEANFPSGSSTVLRVTISGPLAGPSLNETPSHSSEAPRGCAGNAKPKPSRLDAPSNVEPSS